MPLRPLTAAAGLALLVTSLSAAEPDREPPLEITIEIDGQTIDASLGETAEITFDGKPRALKLTAKPTRRFMKAGVEFRYPSHFSYEYNRDSDDPDSATYTVSDRETAVILFAYSPGTFDSADAAATAITEQLREAYPDERVGTTEVRLGGRAVSGRRLSFTSTGTSMIQDLVPVATDDGFTLVLLIQTVPRDDGSEPEETRRVRDLLAETFRVTKPPAAQ